MYSDAMQLLFDEHEIILEAIDQCRELLGKEDWFERQQSLEWFLNFFRQYGDEYHHQKEEDILFTLLARENSLLGESLVESLKEHHVMFREELSEAREALSESDWKRAEKIVRQYLRYLTDHISAENDELFITADEILDDATKESVYFSFLDKDRELGEAHKREFEEKVRNGR